MIAKELGLDDRKNLANMCEADAETWDEFVKGRNLLVLEHRIHVLKKKVKEAEDKFKEAKDVVSREGNSQNSQFTIYSPKENPLTYGDLQCTLSINN